MKFQEITEKEYRKFWENHPLKTFLSAPEISKLREKSGWITYFVGVKKEKNIVAATMLLAHKRHFGKYEFYSPRGYLLDFKDEDYNDNLEEKEEENNISAPIIVFVKNGIVEKTYTIDEEKSDKDSIKSELIEDFNLIYEESK